MLSKRPIDAYVKVFHAALACKSFTAAVDTFANVAETRDCALKLGVSSLFAC